MIWRVIFCWLLATTFACASLPRHSAMGLRTNMTRQLGLATNSVSIGYDGISELTSWAGKESSGQPRLNEQIHYGYDAAGNMLYRSNNWTCLSIGDYNNINEPSNYAVYGSFTATGSLSAPATNVTVNGYAAEVYSDLTFANTNVAVDFGYPIYFTNVAQNIYGSKTTNQYDVNWVTAFGYNPDGSTEGAGGTEIFYDALGRATDISAYNGSTLIDNRLTLDGLGRCRSVQQWQLVYEGPDEGNTWVYSNEVRYIYDGMTVVQERDSNNVPLVTYTRGLDMSGSLQGAGGIGGLLARTDSNGPAFYHADGNGNITALMDSYQRIAARYEYDPYGRLLGKWGRLADANTYRFSSKQYFPSFGMYNFDFRFYMPEMARWPNPDPIGEAGGINLYRAMRNNPMRWVDPFGLDNMYNMAAGNNAPPSMVVSANPSLGETPTVTYQGGQGDLFLIGEFSTAAGTAAVASIMGLIAGGVPPDQAIMLVEEAYEKLVNNASPQPSQNNCPNNTSPIKTPLMGMAKPNNGGGPPHGGSLHDQMINDFINNLPDEADNIRKNQQQVDFFGNPVGNNRPDVQYDLDGVHYNIEFDMNWMRSITHFDEIFENDSVSSIEIHF